MPKNLVRWSYLKTWGSRIRAGNMEPRSAKRFLIERSLVVVIKQLRCRYESVPIFGIFPSWAAEQITFSQLLETAGAWYWAKIWSLNTWLLLQMFLLWLASLKAQFHHHHHHSIAFTARKTKEGLFWASYFTTLQLQSTVSIIWLFWCSG